MAAAGGTGAAMAAAGGLADGWLADWLAGWLVVPNSPMGGAAGWFGREAAGGLLSFICGGRLLDENIGWFDGLRGGLVERSRRGSTNLFARAIRISIIVDEFVPRAIGISIIVDEFVPRATGIIIIVNSCPEP